MKNRILLLAFAIIFLIGFASAIPITTCQEINVSGVYEFQNDIDLSALFGGTCFDIASDNVTIDGKGFRVLDSLANVNQIFQIITARNNLTIKNMVINASLYGIQEYSFSENFTDLTLENITFNNMDYLAIQLDTNGDFYVNNLVMNNILINDGSFYILQLNKALINNFTIIANHENSGSGIDISNNILVSNMNFTGFFTNCLSLSSNINTTFNNFVCAKNSTGAEQPNLISGDETSGNLTFNNLYLSDWNGQALIPSITFDVDNNLPLNYSIIPLYLIPQETVTLENPRLIHGSGDIFNVLSSAGPGLAIFISLMGIALPTLLIGLGFIGVMVAIAFSIATVIRKALGE